MSCWEANRRIGFTRISETKTAATKPTKGLEIPWPTWWLLHFHFLKPSHQEQNAIPRGIGAVPRGGQEDQCDLVREFLNGISHGREMAGFKTGGFGRHFFDTDTVRN